MTKYVSSALFVFSQETENLINLVNQNKFGCEVTPVAFDFLLRQPAPFFDQVSHMVVAGELSDIKTVFNLAMQYGFSVGLIPMAKQKDLINAFDLPKKPLVALEVALRNDSQWLDLVLCNDHILLYKATVGWIPLLDKAMHGKRLPVLYKSMKKLHALKLLNFKFSVTNQKAIQTAASGCMLIQHNSFSLASKFIGNDNSGRNGVFSLLIVSPFSVFEYLKFLYLSISPLKKRRQLPSIIGYIKTKQIDIEPDTALNVFIDGVAVTKTPLHCKVLEKAIRINAGPRLEQESKVPKKDKEIIRTKHLPDEKERINITGKKIPYFSLASEERFRDLFCALREDASINSIYLVMMVLSTVLATIGLYLDSGAVIIGAMLLAPLMSPIVSAAMGLLRQDQDLLNQSAVKIFVGIAIALLASTLVSLIFSYKPVTAEMHGRLNPTILDLAVAIISGIAAAYSKSFKEIIQSLAGVAIAVALVPPLSVAGIGIGRGDFEFFIQAFLLFSTNLVGIILAALFTFRVLGYSPVVKNRRGSSFVVLAMLLIIVPLYLSYEQIVKQMQLEKILKTERYLVNGKYIIVQDVRVGRSMGKKVVIADLLVRESLDRADLHELKKKIEHYYGKKMVIRTRITYIL